ncbi:unnamed protein product, partial [Effrenium voratum]
KTASAVTGPPETFSSRAGRVSRARNLPRTLECQSSRVKPRVLWPVKSSTLARMATVSGLCLDLSFASKSPVPGKCKAAYFHEHFQVTRPLGHGGFGQVFCCKAPDGEHYAVKTVRYKPGAETNVIREAQILAVLRHPNIVRCHHAWIQTDTDGGDTGGSTRASSWPSTPATALANPSAPAPPLKLTEGVQSCDFTFDDGSHVIFRDDCDFELREEEGALTCSQVELPAPSGSSCPKRRSTEELGMQLAATLFLQMELCNGNLQHLIADRNGPLRGPEDTRLEAARAVYVQLLKALAHLESHNCVHRDVKPSNILFGQDGAVRLGDFGLAKWLEQS